VSTPVSVSAVGKSFSTGRTEGHTGPRERLPAVSSECSGEKAVPAANLYPVETIKSRPSGSLATPGRGKRNMCGLEVAPVNRA